MSAYDAPIGSHGPILSPALSLIDLDPAGAVDFDKYGHHDHHDHYEYGDYEDTATEPFPAMNPPHSNSSRSTGASGASAAGSDYSSSPELYFIDEHTSVKVDACAFSTQFTEVAHARKLLENNPHPSPPPLTAAAPALGSRPHAASHRLQHQPQHHRLHQTHSPYQQLPPAPCSSHGAADVARPFDGRDLSYWSHPQPGRRSKWQLWHSQGEEDQKCHQNDEADPVATAPNPSSTTGSGGSEEVGYHHSPTATSLDEKGDSPDMTA